jgi:hypothetical protein
MMLEWKENSFLFLYISLILKFLKQLKFYVAKIINRNFQNKFKNN